MQSCCQEGSPIATTTAELAGELATTVVELAGVFHPQLGEGGAPGGRFGGPGGGFWARAGFVPTDAAAMMIRMARVTVMASLLNRLSRLNEAGAY